MEDNWWWSVYQKSCEQAQHKIVQMWSDTLQEQTVVSTPLPWHTVLYTVNDFVLFFQALPVNICQTIVTPVGGAVVLVLKPKSKQKWTPLRYLVCLNLVYQVGQLFSNFEFQVAIPGTLHTVYTNMFVYWEKKSEWKLDVYLHTWGRKNLLNTLMTSLLKHTI